MNVKRLVLTAIAGFVLLLAGARQARGANFVVASDESSRLYTAVSNGDGTFGALTFVDHLGGSYSRGVVTADFDNDGDLDIVVGRGIGSDGYFYLFLNDGADHFVKSAVVGILSNVNSYVMDMATGDFNNDGRMDFIANGNLWNTGLFLGDGKGGFTKTEMNLGDYGRGLDVADFNHDGNLDFARATNSNGYTYVYPGNGNGTFGARIYVGDTGDDPYALAAGDFNNDGHPDLIVNSGGGGDPYFFAGNGDNTFRAPVYVASLDFNRYGAYDGFDFNGDGNLDVVAANYNGRQILSYPGNGDGTFGAPVTIGSTSYDVFGVSTPPLGPPAGTPIAVIAPASSTIATGAAVSFDGSGSVDPDGSITVWGWNFGDGGTAAAAIPDPHTYAGEGNYTPLLKVTDDAGKSAIATATVTAQGAVPAIDTTPATFSEALADNGVWAPALNGASYASDAEGIASYAWNPGDGLNQDFEANSDAGWSRFAGTWAVTAVAPLTGTYSYTQSDAAPDRTWNLFDKVFDTDLTIEADVHFLSGAGEEAQIVFRARNEQNSYQFILRGRGYNDVLLYRRVNGSDTSLFEYDLPATFPTCQSGTGKTCIDTGRTHHVKIACRGALIQFSLDGIFLFAYSDGTFAGGKVGLSTYRTAALFDNLTVATSAAGQNLQHGFTAGTYNVGLSVTDAAGQRATSAIPLTMQPGAPPVAAAGGPYTVGEAAAAGGGWPVALDGTASSDDVEIRKHVWDLGVDTFDGTAFRNNKWYSNGDVSQNGSVAVTGVNTWETRYLVSRDTFPKVKGQIFEATVTAVGNGQCMFGFKNQSSTSFHYNQFPYEFYLYNTGIYIYENSNSRDFTGFYLEYGVPYDYRIELTGSGAVYSFRRSGATAWTEVYRSSYNPADTVLRKGLVVYSNTYRLDNFRETTAGPNPSFRIYGQSGSSAAAALTVTDRAGQSDTATTTVTLTADAPPLANAGADQSIGEAGAVDGVWTVNFDASGSTDDHGIYLYEWDWNYDGTFDPSGNQGVTASHAWGAPGVSTVAVRVTDNALQSSVDALTVTISQGAPPTARAGGPYAVDENTGAAFDGGFTVTLNGSGSSDGESPIASYVWDLGTDTFSGTALNAGKWLHSAGVTQNDMGTIVSSTNTWGTRYLCSKDTYSRVKGMALEARVRHSGGHAMIGFKNTSANYSYGQFPYAVYFSNGNIWIYESGADRGDTKYDYAFNTWYEVRIELKPTAGARYYYRVAGSPAWIVLYDSAYATDATFRRSVDVHSGTFDVDDVKEIAAGPSPTCRMYGLGSHPLTLTVRDQALQAAMDSTTVTLSANDPPLAVAGPDQVRDEADASFGKWTVAFDGSGSTDDYGILRYEWDWNHSGAFSPSGDTGVTASHVFAAPGVYTVALRVTDHALQSTVDTATVTINVGAPPVADAGADMTTEALWPVVFNGGGSTDDVGLLKYEWAFGDGQTGTGKTPSHSYRAPGVYVATLTVSDKALQTGSDTATVTVLAASGPPLAAAGGPYAAGAGGPPAYFNGGSSTDDHGIVKYLWDVDDTVDSDGDGNFTNDVDVAGRTPLFTYATAGTYTATLTVEDGAGQRSSASATVTVADNLAPNVICVPWRSGDPTIPHETYNGRSVRLKAIVRDAGALTYQWNFGDGSALGPATPATVVNTYAIEADHTYPASPDGTPFTATLTVWDSNGLVGQDNYYIIVQSDNLDTRTNIGIDNGLWFLHKSQGKADGHWASYGSYYASATGSAIQSFEINGHLQDGDNQENPYVETVNRGFGYLFTTLNAVAIGAQTAGNPDTNGNGIGIQVNSGYPIYEGGMVMDAIASSAKPLGFAVSGGANVKGRSYFDILTDMVDMFAWGQSDSGAARGGWMYGWNSGSDNSACQWAAIGMQAAEDTFGINVPRFVKSENNLWLNYSYDGTGFGYSGPGNGVALTPGGMVQLAFDDTFTTDPRWRTAENYIANNWFWQSGNYYAMYALVKAMRLAQPNPVVTFAATGFDWDNHPTLGLRKWLANQQNADGGWPDYYGRTLSSAWSVIMLTPSLFVQPPVADAGADIVWAYGMDLAFSAAGSFHLDPTRAIVKYEWDFDGDGTWDFITTDPADPGAAFAYPDPNPETSGDRPQVFSARLRVTDDNEPPQTDIDIREVTVAEPPHAPFASSGGPYRATAGIPFTLDGGGSFDIDPGDSISRYEWDLDSDGVWFDNDDVDSAIATARWTYAAPGVYNIGLRVADKGVFSPVGCTVGVDCIPLVSQPVYSMVTVEANLSPRANAGGPYTVDEGTTLTFDGSGSADPNGDPLSYAWDLDNDGAFDDASGRTIGWAFTDNGDYVVGLKVSDTLLDNSITVTVHVDNVAPAVGAGPDQTVNEGEVVTFGGSFTDPGSADTQSVVWDFGDGSAAESGTLNPTHAYPDDGVYTVTLTVTDDDGGTGVDTLLVTVNDVTPPTVTATVPANLAADVPVTTTVSATFSERMDPATLAGATFTLSGPSGAVTGVVSYDGATRTATFTPAADLPRGGRFTARVTRGAKDLAGLGLAADYIWVFDTPPPTVSVSFVGSVFAGQPVTITSDYGGIACTWNGVAWSGTCTSAAITRGSTVTLALSVPEKTRAFWGSWCDSATAASCAINNLTADAAILIVTAGDTVPAGVRTTRVSVDSAGTQGDADSTGARAISADGRFVAFHSAASNLVPGDTNGTTDVFVHDRASGTNARGSVASDGNEGDANSTNPAISADGRFVAFASGASNLVPGDTNEALDVFVHDRTTGTTTRVSVDSAGIQTDSDSYGVSISADGRFVAFKSYAANLVPDDTNGVWDVFVHDCTTGATTRVSVDSAGTQGDADSYYPAISADGRFVAFESGAANLVGSDTNGAWDVFVHDRGSGETTLVSVDSAGNQGDGNSTAAAVSADGRFVAFTSTASNLVPGETSGLAAVFVHDRLGGLTTLVSVDSAGSAGRAVSDSPAISADGRFVAFRSDDVDLVNGDTNNVGDIFVHDRATATTRRVSVSAAAVQANSASDAPGVSATGRFVAFSSSASNLVGGDTNGVTDSFVRDTLTPPDNAPVAFDDRVVTAVGAAIDIPVLANDSDADGDPLVVASYSQPAHGTVRVTESNSLIYTPSPDFSGTDGFIYMASDGIETSNVATVSVNVTNMGFTVTPISGLVTTEAGGTASFTVRLDTVPTADVTIALGSSDTTEGTVAPASLTFTPAAALTAQTVTVTGVDDQSVDGSVAYTIVTAAAVSMDANYNGFDPDDVAVTNSDNDVAGFTVAPISGLVTTEAGGTATFTVKLTTIPAATVTVGITSSDVTEGTVAPASLAFTATNWNVPQTVTVTGVDDQSVDGNVAYSIITGAATSTDADYNGLNPADVSVSNTDNDVAGFTVAPISGLITSEAGGTATFTVKLTAIPAATVTVGITSSDVSEGTVAPASLTFTATNWNVPRTVTVTGVDDQSVDGNVAYTSVTAAAVSVDPNYSGLNPANVSVTNLDDDVAGFTVVPSSSLITTEAGGMAFFFVRLNSVPAGTVTIVLTSSNSTEGAVAPASVTFTPATALTAQTVTVIGVDDPIVDGNVAYTIVTAAAVSADANYNGLNPADVSVTNTDNDVAGFTVTPTSGLVTTEASGQAGFTVRLNTAPRANVTISLSSSDLTEGTVSPASLTFTPANALTARTVTVTGVDDHVRDGNLFYSIVTGAAVSNDTAYHGIDPADVSVTNREQPPLPAAVTITANGETDGYNLVPDEPLRVDVRLECGSYCQDPAAVWIKAKAPRTMFYYVGSPGGGTWVREARPSFTGPLAAVAGLRVFDGPLPPGVPLVFMISVALDGPAAAPLATDTVSVGSASGVFESFADGVANGWLADAEPGWVVEGGVFRVFPRGTATDDYSVRFARYPSVYGDFTFGADVRLAESPFSTAGLARGMGLLFRSDGSYDNGYVFHINANGWFTVFKRWAATTTTLVPWTFSERISRGLGYWNRLEVSTAGRDMVFRVNGSTVAAISDAAGDYHASGQPGLKAFGGRDANEIFEFDNVLLRMTR